MSKELNTTWTTSFTVMTQDTNYHFPLIFGGLFFSKIDLCAAQTVTRFLYASDKCEGAVTHKADVSFLKPTYSGDLIVLTGKITSTGKKSVVVEVEARRENHFHQEPDLVAKATLVFVAVKSFGDIESKPDLLPYAEHGLG